MERTEKILRIEKEVIYDSSVNYASSKHYTYCFGLICRSVLNHWEIISCGVGDVNRGVLPSLRGQINSLDMLSVKIEFANRILSIFKDGLFQTFLPLPIV